MCSLNRMLAKERGKSWHMQSKASVAGLDGEVKHVHSWGERHKSKSGDARACIGVIGGCSPSLLILL